MARSAWHAECSLEQTTNEKGMTMSKALAALLLVTMVAADSPSPREVIQSGIDRVTAVLAGAQVAPSNRAARDKVRAEIRQIASEIFDFGEVARRALSRHWADRTPAEQAEFVALFTDLLERAYISKIEAYSDEKIVYTNEIVDGAYASVRSRVISHRRTETALDYRLHLTNARWRVYDILVDGVSFVSTFRVQFDRVIQSSSYEDLVERLRKKSLDIRVQPIAERPRS